MNPKDADIAEIIKLLLVALLFQRMLVTGSAGAALAGELFSLKAQDIQIRIHLDLTTVVIDLGSLGDGIESLSETLLSQRLAREFVLRGASARMCSELFGLSAVGFKRMRASEGMAGKQAGRPRMPPLEVRGRILEAWPAICERTADPRWRYLVLSDMFPNVSIRSLEQLIIQEGVGQ